MYFNKCIEALTLTSHEPHLTDIDVNMLGGKSGKYGKYYDKYMKYKSKYLNLKATK